VHAQLPVIGSILEASQCIAVDRDSSAGRKEALAKIRE
jgi:hypothetical protein